MLFASQRIAEFRDRKTKDSKMLINHLKVGSNIAPLSQYLLITYKCQQMSAPDEVSSLIELQLLSDFSISLIWYFRFSVSSSGGVRNSFYLHY